MLLFGPFAWGGRVLWSQDIGRIYYPVATLLQHVLETGDVARLLWNPDLAAGFPLVADGATTPFHPLHWGLLLLLAPERALSVALFLGYLGSALAMAGFARVLGLSRYAAAVAGLVYSCSGFAMGHCVHVNVIAGLPFLPLVLLFLERAARAAKLRYATLAGLAWGLQCLAGHPQIAVMTAALGVGYAAFRLWPVAAGARELARPAGVVLLFLAVGSGLSAIYYLPMAELAGLSVRAEGGLTLAQAAAYSLPWPHLFTAVSPFFFFESGSGAYRGAWNPAEMAFYAGVPTLVLAALALLTARRDPFVRFFAGVGGLATVLALGDATPLHALLHALPVFSNLRGPARYLLLLDVSLAMLAAYGLDALRRDDTKRARVARLTLLGAVLACGLPLLEPLWQGRLVQDGWLDAAWVAGVPVLLRFKELWPPAWLALTGLWLRRRPAGAAPWWPGAGVALVALDLLAFAATTLGPQWVRPEAVIGSDATRSLGLEAQRGRVYVIDSPEPWRAASDLSLVRGFPSLTAYVSLPLARHAAYTRAFWLSDQSAQRLLDSAAVRLVVDAWQRPLEPRLKLGGEEFSPRHPIAFVGSGTGERRFRFSLGDIEADRIRLVTALQGGGELAQNTIVARLTLLSDTEPGLVFVLRAGRETAERNHDTHTAHAQPPLRLSAWSLVDRRSEGDFYLAALSWPALRRVRALDLEYLAPQGRLMIFGGSAGTDPGRGTALSPFMGDGYRRLREQDGAVRYENTHALPRAYAVHQVVRATDATAAIRAIVDGTVQPGVAVGLEDAGAPSPTGSGPSTVAIEVDEPERVELAASMLGDGYVVLADTYYPGWRATVDDAPATIYAANGLFRAVFVADGVHRVAFRYEPRAVYRGGFVSALTLVLAAVLALRRRSDLSRAQE